MLAHGSSSANADDLHVLMPCTASSRFTRAHAVLPTGARRLVKVVVSATLTRDPAKLQRLSLHAPRYVATVANTAPAAAGSGGAAGGASAAAAAGGSVYSLPKSLDERRVLCSAARKPLVLVALLRQLAGQATIVFTSSVDMTHK